MAEELAKAKAAAFGNKNIGKTAEEKSSEDDIDQKENIKEFMKKELDFGMEMYYYCINDN